MDRIKLNKLITENMKSIFGFALTRLANVSEADELASDILYEIIRSADHLKDDSRFYGFLWKIAENTYMDYLRKKSRNANKTAELDENIVDESDLPLEKMMQKEELNLLRRELSLLSKQYRDTTVLYYMEHLSCSEVAEKLHISTEMVKYYLFRARKIIREGMNMERLFGEKSYRPSIFEIDFWGTKAGDDREYQDFQKRKIKGNILLAAYYSPMTMQELSIELGVALPYLEDEIKLLMDRQYLVCNNEKYLTNIPIFTTDCTKAIDEKIEEMTKAAAETFIAASDTFFARFSDRFANENLARFQKVLLCLHASLIETGKELGKGDGELPSDGPYSFVNGGGGRGVIWGRSIEYSEGEELPRGIQGIYNGSPSKDGDGSVIAMNFRQTLNAQRFEGGMTDAVVRTACGRFGDLPNIWKERMKAFGYALEGKPNFAVWSFEEYDELRTILRESIDILSELNHKTAEIAAGVTADLAPAHIRKTAEYVGALVYRFHAVEKFVDVLYEQHWLKSVSEKEKPALCVVKYKNI